MGEHHSEAQCSGTGTSGAVNASVFEALFVLGVSPSAELLLSLKGLGVDLAHLRSRYDSLTWIAAIDAATRTTPLGATDAETQRLLGQAFTDGFLRTASGRLLGLALPFISIESLLDRLERYLRLGRADIEVDVRLGPGRSAVIEVTDPAGARPHFFTGMLEGALLRLDLPFTLSPQPGDAQHFAVHVTWSDRG